MQVKRFSIDKITTRIMALFTLIILAGCTVAPTRHAAPRYHAPYAHPRTVVLYR
ncbi:hypothetical protein ACR9PT_12270 [Piscirickettsia salmonis]|uniref:hypothetical protein n=1 Tax=Piscirickettsia salmonis TaxID=1238 RepID=UPI003EBF0B18